MDSAAPWKLSDTTVLVTGASSGLGRHFANTLSRAGAQVVVAARRADRLDAVVGELRAQGHRALALAMDVTSADSVSAAFDQLAQQGILVNVLVNNAGVSIHKPALAQTPGDWDAVLDTNLKGAWLVATEAARRLVSAKQGGSIINIASLLSHRVAGSVAPYCASKAGLDQLTRALALEWARHGIRVNALSPGYIATELNQDFLSSEAGEKMRSRIPQRRFGEAAQLDGPLLLLASEASAYMTGSTIVVDGGHQCSTV